MKHLLAIEELTTGDINAILDWTELPFELSKNLIKKDFVQINAFYENSTRTRVSFEMAGKKLGGNVINFDVDTSSEEKGETFVDTMRTLGAMEPDVIVVRHGRDHFPKEVARVVNCSVINAGAGIHEHPTQALTDALTLRNHFGSLEGLNVAIVGDILRSRVARSNVILLEKMGAHVTVIGPKAMLPAQVGVWAKPIASYNMQSIIGCDAVMMLRYQRERMCGELGSIYREDRVQHDFTLTQERLEEAGNPMVLHPGPINQGVEITEEVAYGPKSLILQQVRNGVRVRMAVLSRLIGC